eukprot:7248565-Prymnesium_polylepis.1
MPWGPPERATSVAKTEAGSDSREMPKLGSDFAVTLFVPARTHAATELLNNSRQCDHREQQCEYVTPRLRNRLVCRLGVAFAN